MASSSSEAPPSYQQATGGRTYQTRNGIPPQRRRSMEDEIRPLPNGWVRQYDIESEHQFFVDTTKDPPRSIWCHPYDDPDYLESLSPSEREHITRLHRSVSLKDIEAESSDDESHLHPGKAGSSTAAKRMSGSGHAAAVGAASGSSSSGVAGTTEQPTGVKKFGRKLKDRVTGSTHDQRERDRVSRSREEEEAYRQHLAFRNALTRAMQTGEPQYIGKDREGRDMYVQPPNGPRPLRAQGVPGGAMGLNPYGTMYGSPNAMFLRPTMPYSRPYGYGYGGGYGMPIMGGLLGGALLGGLMF